MKSTIESGREGQALAADMLRSAGYRIIIENYRHGMLGEIDIIAEKESLCVFVEVKLRINPRYDTFSSINGSKIAHIKRTAQIFLVRHPEISAKSCRFDLISIVNGSLEWHKDIFR